MPACLPACLILAALLIDISAAVAQTMTWVRCFRKDSAFDCCDPAVCVDGDWGPPGGFDELAVELSRSPFMQAGAQFGDTSASDLDEDTLVDRMELELAESFAPYVVNAWKVSYWDGEPHLGEPVLLFQVHPDGVQSAGMRRIRIVMVFLHDFDSGYRTPDGCADGWNAHCGDASETGVTVEMVDGNPRLWKPNRAAIWWYHPTPPGADGRIPAGWAAGGLHPVFFFTKGKHHWERVGERCRELIEPTASCDESVWCPGSTEFLAGSHGDWCDEDVTYWDFGSEEERLDWHNRVGRYLVPAVGTAARLEGFPDAAVDPLIGNNVGEKDHHGWPFVDDLSTFCLYGERGRGGEMGISVCFWLESAWADQPFTGGWRDLLEFCNMSSSPSVGEKWDYLTYRDLDGDGIPNDEDACYLSDPDVLPPAVPGEPVSDVDGDGLADECDICPDDWNPGQEDRDGDGVGDACDGCPADPTVTADPRMAGPDWPTVDADLDTLLDRCDLCPYRARSGAVSDRGWAQVNASPGDWLPLNPDTPFDELRAPGRDAPVDSDGDDIGDECDLCPFRVGDPSGWPCRPDDASCWEFWGRLAEVDRDRDGVGDHCDNCPTVANSDQANCNRKEDERAWLIEHGGGLGGFVPTGDACDATPCVAPCGLQMGWAHQEIEPSSTVHVVRHEELCVTDPDGHEICPQECYVGEPAEMRICPVGFPDPDAAPDHDATAHDLRWRNMSLDLVTEFRGCGCTDSETHGPDRECETIYCPQTGELGGGRRWFHGTYPGQVGAETLEPQPPLYAYWRTYATLAGFPYLPSAVGERYERMDGYESWYRYFADTWSTGDPDKPYRRQEWNFLSDMADPRRMPAGDDPETPDVVEPPPFSMLKARDVHAWYRPLPDLAAGFGGFGRSYGNSYLSTAGLGGFLYRCDSGDPASWSGLVDIIGRYLEPYGTEAWTSLVKLPGLRAYATVLGSDCPNCVGYLFDTPGAVVGGLAIATWDQTKQYFSSLVASKLVGGASFDLLKSSIAYAADANGRISNYWLFGGMQAGGGVTDQFWAGNLTMQLDTGGSAGTSFFALSPIERTVDSPWPAARTGAVFVHRGSATCAGGLPPNVDMALGAASMGQAASMVRPNLLLAGGADSQGPLADIWLYDGSWRQAGTLPGVEQGLADAGAAVVDGALWLFGGRQGSGPSADLWRIDLASGVAERLLVAGGPGARVSPATAYRESSNELLVFGGTRGSSSLNDLWAYNIESGSWRQLAASCTSPGCPVSTGAEQLVATGAGDEVTVVADASGPGRTAISWNLRAGTWIDSGELRQIPSVGDCDHDGMDEAAWGARCGAGDEGFPAWGTMRCDAAADVLVCRAPAAPGRLLAEARARGAKAVLVDGHGIGLLRERELAWYDIGNDGSLVPTGELRLARPSDDAVVVRGRVLVADRAGLTVYDRATGAVQATLPTCGKARRVFADGRRVYVVGLRSILVVDLTNASAPAILRDLRFAALPDGSAWAEPSTRCGAFYAVADVLCDWTGLCGLSGRIAAAEQGHRLALAALGRTFVLDFREGLIPVVSPGMVTGPLTGLRMEGNMLYTLEPCSAGAIYVEEDGDWTYAGRDDVSRWVAGVVETGPFSASLRAGRVAVGTRQ